MPLSSTGGAKEACVPLSSTGGAKEAQSIFDKVLLNPVCAQRESNPRNQIGNLIFYH